MAEEKFIEVKPCFFRLSSSVSITALNEQGSLWQWNALVLILIALAILFLALVVGVSVCWWYDRRSHPRRQPSLPTVVNALIETKKLEQEHFIPSTSKIPPPVPPRPTAYPNVFGQMEYRSNL